MSAHDDRDLRLDAARSANRAELASRRAGHGRESLTGLALTALLATQNASSVGFATVEPWASGNLSAFLQLHADEGYGNPLFKPLGISLVAENAHVIDLGLQNHSILVGVAGRMDFAPGGSIVNYVDGVLSFDGLHHIISVAGLANTPSISNEGLFTVGGPITVEMNGVELDNANGGIIRVADGARLMAPKSNIHTNSRFEGTGFAQIAGFIDGAVFSEGSLVVAGKTTGAQAEISGEWRFAGAASEQMLGTWTNRGVLRAGYSGAEQLFGKLGPGANFINEGTMIGANLRLVGTEGFLPTDERTHLVNNGLIELSGLSGFATDGAFSVSGTDAVMVENHGTLRVKKGVTNFMLDNDGTIDASGGGLQIFGGNDPHRSRAAATFRNGSQLIASTQGVGILLQDSGASSPGDFDFFGAIHAENVTLEGHGLYRGTAAVLSGDVEWASGTFTGSWMNLGTIAYQVNSSSAREHFIDGSFLNFGTMTWRKKFDLASAAAAVNSGLFSMTPNAGTRGILSGVAGGPAESFSNLGHFVTASPGTILDNISFSNVGTLEIAADGPLTVNNSNFENIGIITAKGRLELGSAIVGGFKNSGRVEARSEIRLLNGASVVNDGIYDMQPGAGRQAVLQGSTGAPRESFINNGRFMTTTAGKSFFVDIDFTNRGSLEIRDGGTLVVGSGTRLENFGTILGNGTLLLAAQFINHGTIAPGLSPGKLIINGSFVNASDGVLDLEIASASVFDVLEFTANSTVKLGGKLRLHLLDGFVPTVGEEFTFLNYSSFSGAFDSVELVGFDGARFGLAYTPTSFRLNFDFIPTPVPLPASLGLLAAAMPLLRWRRRRNFSQRHRCWLRATCR